MNKNRGKEIGGMTKGEENEIKGNVSNSIAYYKVLRDVRCGL